MYTLRGKIAVDCLCKHEELISELNVVCREVLTIIDEETVLPNLNLNAERKPHQEVLSQQDEGTIARLFADEVALFNYEF